MVNVKVFKPAEQIVRFVRKIVLLSTTEVKEYKQTVLISPFTYFSFVPYNYPTPYVNGKKEPLTQRLYFTGPYLQKEIYLIYQGNIKHLVFELSASGMYSLFHISPLRLIDRLINLKDIVSPGIYNELIVELAETKSILGQKTILENFLIYLVKNARTVYEYVEKALNIIEEHKGYIPIKNIVDIVNISERQFRRKFKEVVGLQPKQYCELLNSHFIITYIQQKDYKSIQDLAFNSKFYDMPHFCHRFKKLTGFQPSKFINTNEADFAKKIYSLK